LLHPASNSKKAKLMMRWLLLLAIPLTLCVSPLTSYSDSPSWIVEKTTGSASYSREGMSPLPVLTGMTLAEGESVTTGDNGRVLLVRHEETVFIGPNTIAAIAREPADGLRTTVLLERGSADFKVQKRGRKHFSVQTPYMAAVVKGTQFVVTVSSDLAEVAVTEGLVEVRTADRSVDVAAGKRATVASSGEITLAEGKSGDPMRSVQQDRQDQTPKVKSTDAKNKQSKSKSGKGHSSGKGSSGSNSGHNGSGGSGSGSSGSGSSGSGSSGSGGGGSGGGSSGRSG
jgi:hypothetical protein